MPDHHTHWSPAVRQRIAEARAEGARAVLDEVGRRVEAWIRHGESVPADVTSYDRWIVHAELRDLMGCARAHLLRDRAEQTGATP